MFTVLAGLAVLVVTVFLFWKLLPQEGRAHRLVQSIWGPYVGVSITSGLAIGFTMVVAGVIGLFG
jgi:hypothetical protein